MKVIAFVYTRARKKKSFRRPTAGLPTLFYQVDVYITHMMPYSWLLDSFIKMYILPIMSVDDLFIIPTVARHPLIKERDEM